MLGTFYAAAIECTNIHSFGN